MKWKWCRERERERTAESVKTGKTKEKESEETALFSCNKTICLRFEKNDIFASEWLLRFYWFSFHSFAIHLPFFSSRFFLMLHSINMLLGNAFSMSMSRSSYKSYQHIMAEMQCICYSIFVLIYWLSYNQCGLFKQLLWSTSPSKLWQSLSRKLTPSENWDSCLICVFPSTINLHPYCYLKLELHHLLCFQSPFQMPLKRFSMANDENNQSHMVCITLHVCV